MTLRIDTVRGSWREVTGILLSYTKFNLQGHGDLSVLAGNM